MIDAYQLLWAKETDLVRVRKEVESLRIVATLLSDTDETQTLPRDEGLTSTGVELDKPNSNENAQHDEPLPDPTALTVELKKQNSRESSPRPRIFRNWLGRIVGE
jgi:hypothetical protein